MNKLFALVAGAMIFAGCPDVRPAPEAQTQVVQPVNPTQPAPIVIQQRDNTAEALMLGTALGYMAGSGNNSAPTQPQSKTVAPVKARAPLKKPAKSTQPVRTQTATRAPSSTHSTYKKPTTTYKKPSSGFKMRTKTTTTRRR